MRLPESAAQEVGRSEWRLSYQQFLSGAQSLSRAKSVVPDSQLGRRLAACRALGFRRRLQRLYLPAAFLFIEMFSFSFGLGRGIMKLFPLLKI